MLFYLFVENKSQLSNLDMRKVALIKVEKTLQLKNSFANQYWNYRKEQTSWINQLKSIKK